MSVTLARKCYLIFISVLSVRFIINKQDTSTCIADASELKPHLPSQRKTGMLQSPTAKQRRHISDNPLSWAITFKRLCFIYRVAKRSDKRGERTLTAIFPEWLPQRAARPLPSRPASLHPAVQSSSSAPRLAQCWEEGSLHTQNPTEAQTITSDVLSASLRPRTALSSHWKGASG